jgi:hypothetical protein
LSIATKIDMATPTGRLAVHHARDRLLRPPARIGEDVADIEAFLAGQPNNRARRLTVLGQFFRFTRSRRMVLVDPTRSVVAKRHRGFRGRTITIIPAAGIVPSMEYRSRRAPP